MAAPHDYYAILQVHPQAEPEIIDAAYRKLAAKYHPDVSHAADAATRMKEINVAYEVLSDPDRRAAYDAACRIGPRTQPRPRPAAPPRTSSSWRGYILPVAIILFVAVASRFGIQAALIFAAFLLLLVLYLISPPKGSKR